DGLDLHILRIRVLIARLFELFLFGCETPDDLVYRRALRLRRIDRLVIVRGGTRGWFRGPGAGLPLRKTGSSHQRGRKKHQRNRSHLFHMVKDSAGLDASRVTLTRAPAGRTHFLYLS